MLEEVNINEIKKFVVLVIVSAILVISFHPFTLENNFVLADPPIPMTFVGYIYQSNGTPIDIDGVPITVYNIDLAFYDNKTTNPGNLTGANYLFSITAGIGNQVLIECVYNEEQANIVVEAQEGSVWTNITLFPQGWYCENTAPITGGYGEAVVGAGNYVYIAKCYNDADTPSFWRYNPHSDNWQYMNVSALPQGAFRNGLSLCWDKQDTIYALAGARYSLVDNDYRKFYAYSISNNAWEQLADTPHGQGAGNAIAYSTYDDHIYAILGNKNRGSSFAFYNSSGNSWTTLSLNPSWGSKTDDGCSLEWTDSGYLYALRGEYDESVPNGDFARYHISTHSWEDLPDLPDTNGVGDGGSLLWQSSYRNFIFALSGGEADEDPGYHFYCYAVKESMWETLADIPFPVGHYVGNRLAYANSTIYYWQGAPSTWDGDGNRFCYYALHDWNNWDDDHVVMTGELQDMVYHWVFDVPKNGHIVTTTDLQAMVYMWLNS